MISIDFRKIRPIRGSANNGFEELCCQIASSDLPSAGPRPIRNGTPDGGVEIYWIQADGSEHGWQAKYFFDLDHSQWQQLDGSVETALKKHPNLSHYTVCLPIDLPDARVENQRSLRQKWDDRAKKWEAMAADLRMSVTFGLWGEHELLTRLALEKHSGRRWFWFQETELSSTWFSNHLGEALAGAGPRYNKEFNVELPVALAFEALGYTAAFRERIAAVRIECRQRFGSALTRLERTKAAEDVAVALESVRRSGEALLACLHEFGDAPPPQEHHQHLLRLLREADYAAEEMSGDLHRITPIDPPSAGSGEPAVKPTDRPFEYEQHALQQYRSAIDEVNDLLDAASAELAGRPAMLLAGQAGNGKTHLLCDVAKHRIGAGLPTLIFLGQQFGRGDVWTQIVQRLGLRCTRDEPLGALESAAEAADGRALIFIDALNEAPDVDWRNEVPPFLEVLSRHPLVGIAVSCRTSYERQLVREELLPERLSRVEHDGFAPRLFEAISAFCRFYHIETLNAPPLNPEFENPLFLKLFCQGLHNRGMSRPPKGHHGLQRIFSFLIDSVNEKLHHPTELDYPEDDRVIQRAVDEIADAMVDSGRYAIPRAKAQVILEKILPRPGQGYSRSLLKKLVAEGILADDNHMPEAGEPPEPIVRFGYERLADYQLARRLLDRWLKPESPEEAFLDDQPFGKIFLDEVKTYRLRGLLSALIVLVPERTGCELSELMPRLAPMRAYSEAFLESLPWREGRHITSQAIEFIGQLLERGEHDSAMYSASDVTLERVVQLAAQPDHPLNARWLHTRLLSLAMPDRDLRWSTFLHRSRRERAWAKPGAVERLLDWAWPEDADGTDSCAGFDDEVVILAAITLTWCFTTPNRFIRDRATKALVCVLRHRLHLIPPLLDEFRTVDDPYVAERLYCAVYGCVMRSGARQQVEAVTSGVYHHVFSTGTPPTQILLRDYARDVIEYTLSMGWRFEFDPAYIRPPYRSDPPPVEVPSWEDLRKTYGGREYSDFISSLWPDHGDFARYVLGSDSRGLHTWTDQPGPYEELRRLDAERRALPQPLAAEWHQVRFGRMFEKLRFRVGPDPDGNDDDEQQDGDSDDREGESETNDQIEEYVAEIKRFRASLTPEERELLDRHEAAESRWREVFESAEEAERRLHGESDLPCRWILTRVMELGWTPERFARFDREVSRNNMREAQKAERIGKKYQWIAYHELAARVFDHRPFQHEQSSGSHQYEGPWQGAFRTFRDIDPSFLVKVGPPKRNDSRCWWFPLKNPLLGIEHLADQDWLTHFGSIPDFGELLSVRRPSDPTIWYPLHSSGEWKESDEQRDRSGHFQRRITFSLNAFLTRNADAPTFFEAVRLGTWTGMDVSGPDFYEQYLGEFAWAPSFRELNEDARAELAAPYDPNGNQRTWFRGVEFPVARTVMRYLHEGRGFDCSLTESSSGSTPSIWMARRMGLSWGRNRFTFIGPTGRVVGFDPSHESPGPRGFLIEQSAFRRFLSDNGLTIVWLLIGEKLLLGGPESWHQDRELPRVSVFRQAFQSEGEQDQLILRTLGHLGSSASTY